MQTTGEFILASVCLGVTALFITACDGPGPATSNGTDRSDAPNVGEPVTQERPAPAPVERVLIDAIILTDELDDDRSPVTELVTVPNDARSIYLAVLVRDVDQGTEFGAEWVKDGETVARSERRVGGSGEGHQWIALRFAPDGGFEQANYAVRLSVNGAFIESLVFKVGDAPAPADADSDARLFFASSWSADQASISARTSFDAGTRRVVAILTNVTDQSATYVSYWHRDGQFFAEITADPVRVASVRTFTLESSEAIPVGTYSVTIFLVDEQVSSSAFVIEDAPEPEEITTSSIIGLAVTAEVNEETRQGLTDSVTDVEPPVTLHAMVLVDLLIEEDALDVFWYRNGEVVSYSPVAGQRLRQTWVISDYNLPIEDGDADAEYHVVVLLNGEEVARHEFIARRPD
jgi:hypothetical protein